MNTADEFFAEGKRLLEEVDKGMDEVAALTANGRTSTANAALLMHTVQVGAQKATAHFAAATALYARDSQPVKITMTEIP